MWWNKPKLYSVYLHPEHESPYETAVFVPEGFNMWAFVFHGLWLMMHRMWFSGVVTLMIIFLVVQLPDSADLELISAVILRLGIQLFIGFEGNDMRRLHLARKGYLESDVVVGTSLLEAQQRYLDRRISFAAVDATSSPSVMPFSGSPINA